MTSVKPIPDGYNTVTVSMVVPDVGKAIDFYQKAFGAVGGACLRTPDGKSIIHGEVRLGDSAIILGPENPAWGSKSPLTFGGSPVSMHVYVTDADSSFLRAVQAGCEVVFPMEDTFWGDRFGKVKDPFGHTWGFGTRKEELSPAEIEKRGHEWMSKMMPAS